MSFTAFRWCARSAALGFLVSCCTAVLPSPASAQLSLPALPGLGSLPILGPILAPAAPPAPSDPLDVSTALRLTPPFVTASQNDAATDDDGLTDQLVIQICRTGANGCTAVTTFSGKATDPTTKITPGQSKQYTAVWNTVGLKEGDVFRFTFRVAGLSLGSVQMRAGNITEIGRTGRFLPGLPLRITFAVARHVVVTTRSMRDRGASAVDIGQKLQQAFRTTDSNTLTAAYRDARPGFQDIDRSLFPGGDTSVARVAAAAGCSHPPCPLPLGQVVDSVASPSTFATGAARAAELLKARTPSGNQTVVNAISSSEALQSRGLSPGAVLAIIRSTLGVTERLAGLKLLKGAQDDNGASPFDANGVLAAIIEVDGLTQLLPALQQLSDVGFAVGQSIAAVTQVESLLPAGLPRATKIARLATAALQVPDFAGTDTANALGMQFPHNPPDSDVSEFVAALATAGRGLVDDNCASFTHPLEIGSVPALLKAKTDVLSATDVIRQLAQGRCQFSDPSQLLTAIHHTYTSEIQNRALESIDLTNKLLTALPATPATPLLIGLGRTLRDAAAVPGEKLACFASLGLAKGSRKPDGSMLPGVPTPSAFSVPGIMPALDATSTARGVFPEPFKTGPGGSLDDFGKCLVGNGVVPPLPLRKLTVRFHSGRLTGTTILNSDILWTARAGYLPQLPNAVPGGLGLDALKLTGVPNLGLPLAGSLKDITTLPVLAIGPGQYSRGNQNFATPFSPFETTCFFCGGERLPLIPLGVVQINSDGETRNFTTGLVSTQGSNLKTLTNGLVPFSLGAGGSNGVLNMVVPALPGSVNLESVQYANPDITCGNSPNPAITALDIAAPYYGVIENLPGSDNQWMVKGNMSIPLPLAPSRSNGTWDQFFAFNLDGRGAGTASPCARFSYGGEIEGDVSLTPIGSITELAQLATNLVAPITTRGATMPGGGNADLTGVKPLSSLDPGGLAGNFMSLLATSGLASTGGAPLTGTMLGSLMTTGFPG